MRPCGKRTQSGTKIERQIASVKMENSNLKEKIDRALASMRLPKKIPAFEITQPLPLSEREKLYATINIGSAEHNRIKKKKRQAQQKRKTVDSRDTGSNPSGSNPTFEGYESDDYPEPDDYPDYDDCPDHYDHVNQASISTEIPRERNREADREQRRQNWIKIISLSQSVAINDAREIDNAYKFQRNEHLKIKQKRIEEVFSSHVCSGGQLKPGRTRSVTFFTFDFSGKLNIPQCGTCDYEPLPIKAYCWPSAPKKLNYWFEESLFSYIYNLRHTAGCR